MRHMQRAARHQQHGAGSGEDWSAPGALPAAGRVASLACGLLLLGGCAACGGSTVTFCSKPCVITWTHHCTGADAARPAPAPRVLETPVP